METKANYVAIGAFVVATTLGMLIALLWLAGAQYREEYSYYKTYFSGAVTGLGNGTTVRYNGIDVGHVSKLNFDPDDPKTVIVTLQVSPSLPIHSDSVASIASEGLTGGSYVEIDGGSKSSPILPSVRSGEYPVIHSKVSTWQEIEQSAPQLIGKLNHIADSLNEILGPKNQTAIAELLDHLRNTTGDVDRHQGDLDKTLDNIASASHSLDTDLADVHHLLAGADKTVQNLNVLSNDIDTQVNSAQLAQLSSDTHALEQSLTDLSNEIGREPTSIIFGDRRKGYTPP